MTSLADRPASHVANTFTPLSQSLAMTPDSRSAAAGNQPAICPHDRENIAPFRTEATTAKRKIERQSWEYVVRSGTAGGIAACAAKSVVAPLDRVKILFQASNPQFAKYTGSWAGVARATQDIYKASGTAGLFRGHSATLLRIFPYGGIKFLAYEQIRAVVIPTKHEETHVRRFAAGSMAGIVSVFCTYPLEVIRVRLAWETNPSKRIGVRDICRKIYNEQPPPPASGNGLLHTAGLPKTATATLDAAQAVIRTVTPATGLSNFFRGFTPTLWGMIPYAGASFLTHDAAGDFMRLPSLAPYTVLPASELSPSQLAPGKAQPLRWWAELTTGAVAGFVSQTVSYPLEVIRRRMQVGGVIGDGHRMTMVEVGKKIFQEKGYRGFFVGLSIGWVKVVPMAATSFFVYERMKVTFGI
jgi:solute carrier family 25 protein 16